MMASPADLWRVQSELLHRQLGHILLIRGWAASLTAGIVVAIVTAHEPLVGAGGLVLIAFWYTEHVYGKFLDVYAAREASLRLWLAQTVQNPSVASTLSSQVSYRRGLPRIVSYTTMLGVVVFSAIYVGCAL